MIAYFRLFHQMSMRPSPRPNAAAILRRAGVPALLVTTRSNIRYCTGIALSSGIVLVSSAGFELFVDGRYIEAARKKARRGVSVRPVGEWQNRLKKLRRVGVEADEVTLSRFTAWKRKYKNTKFVQTSGIVEEFRRSKKPEELRDIRQACKVTKAVLRLVPHMLKIGIREKDLAWQLDSESRRRGADGMAFETIVAFGEHTSSPHHHPTDRRLLKGDLIQVDMGAAFRGYCSDYSRVFFTGKPTGDQAKALRALKRAKSAAEAMIRVGVTNRILDQTARDVLKKYGYDEEFSHALGHGLGLDIHETPTVSMKAPMKRLRKNEVITIEPGLYFPGEWGIRIEDTIVVS